MLKLVKAHAELVASSGAGGRGSKAVGPWSGTRTSTTISVKQRSDSRLCLWYHGF